jgi:hypothetical protein
MYLALSVVGHMDLVFMFGRTYLGVDELEMRDRRTCRLIQDAWNIRLVPD